MVTRRQFRGAEVFAANLSMELLKEKNEIVFVGLYSAPKNPLTVNGAVNIDLNGKKSKVVSLRLLWNLKKIIEREKPDIIQVNGSDSLKYAALIKWLMPSLPITYRNISIISTWVGNNTAKLYIYRKLFSFIDYVTCVGEVARQDFIRTIGFNPEKVTVINRGIPIQFIDKKHARNTLRSKLCLDAADKIVAHVGNFSYEKNHKFLLDVFEYLKKQDQSIKLILLGEGQLEYEIRSKVEEKGLSDTVFFGGFTSQVQEIIAGCDLFALCSKVEGVPGVILEAAAQKVPAIAVDVGGVKEVVKHNITGILLPRHDAKQFAKEIIDILKDNNKREALALNAFSLVNEDYNPTINLQKFLNLYKGMLL